MVKKDMPVGVKILAILGYIGAALTLLAGILLIFGASFMAQIMSQIGPLAAVFGGIGFVVLGIIFIAFAVLDYFIAKGLWNGKNWARIIVIVFAALGILGGITSPLNNIVGIIINGVIIWYLGFNKPVARAFK